MRKTCDNQKHHLHIELTAEQYQQLCRQAKLCGLCKRAYIVRLIDGTPRGLFLLDKVYELMYQVANP